MTASRPCEHRTVRTYLHTDGTRAFTASVVAPLALVLQATVGVARVELGPGWLGGPHLDLTVRADENAVPWSALAAALGDAASDLPSRPLDDASYQRLAGQLARLEWRNPPFPPLRAHGTVEIIDNATPVTDTAQAVVNELRSIGRHHLLGTLCDTAAVADRRHRLGVIAEVMLALAATHPAGIPYGVFSFRSHAEAFLHWTAPDDAYHVDYRLEFDRRYDEDRVALERLTLAALAGERRSLATRWHESFLDLTATYHDATARGELTDQTFRDVSGTEPDTDHRGPPGAEHRPVSGRSAFHTAVDATDLTGSTGSWFPAYRLLLNVFYELLPVIDVTPLQRFYLCHACATAVDHVTNTTWLDRLEHAAARRASD